MPRTRRLITFAPNTTRPASRANAIGRPCKPPTDIVIARARNPMVLILGAALPSADLDAAQVLTRAIDAWIVLARAW